MEIKTSKIKEIHQIKPFNNSYGTTYYHQLLLENGEKIEIGKKKEMKVGWEITYSVDVDGSQHEYSKAKSEQPQNQVFQKKGGSKGGNASFALSYAKDLAVAYVGQGKDFTSDEIIKVAEAFNDWLNSKP